MTIRRLDLDLAIYRDRVQIALRGGDSFVDQRAEYPFSSDSSLVAEPRFLEDTLVRAIRKILAEGGFSLRDPIAHVIRYDGEIADGDRSVIEAALHETGVSQVIFEIG